MNNNDTAGSLGGFIRDARLALGLSRLGLATKAGVDLSNISRIESGETKQPTVRVLGRIADALEVDVAQLLAYQGVPRDGQAQSTVLTTYLRSLHLPDKAITEVQEEIARISKKYRSQDDFRS